MTRKEVSDEWVRLMKTKAGKPSIGKVILDRRRFGELLRRTANGGFNDGAEWMEERIRVRGLRPKEAADART